jgi:hypothetical protein
MLSLPVEEESLLGIIIVYLRRPTWLEMGSAIMEQRRRCFELESATRLRPPPLRQLKSQKFTSRRGP